MKLPMNSPIRRVSFEPSDNGGFISKTEREPPPRKKNGPYIDYDDRVSTNVHPTVNHAAAHLVQSFGGKKKGVRKPAAAPSSQWGGVANGMLGGGANPVKGY